MKIELKNPQVCVRATGPCVAPGKIELAAGQSMLFAFNPSSAATLFPLVQNGKAVFEMRESGDPAVRSLGDEPGQEANPYASVPRKGTPLYARWVKLTEQKRQLGWDYQRFPLGVPVDGLPPESAAALAELREKWAAENDRKFAARLKFYQDALTWPAREAERKARAAEEEVARQRAVAAQAAELAQRISAGTVPFEVSERLLSDAQREVAAAQSHAKALRSIGADGAQLEAAGDRVAAANSALEKAQATHARAEFMRRSLELRSAVKRAAAWDWFGPSEREGKPGARLPAGVRAELDRYTESARGTLDLATTVEELAPVVTFLDLWREAVEAFEASQRDGRGGATGVGVSIGAQ